MAKERQIWLNFALTSSFALSLLACRTQQKPPQNEVMLSKTSLGDKWPFSVESGVLSCVANPLSPGMPAVIFKTGETTYGINGGALTGNAFAEIDPIVLRNKVGLYKVPLSDLISEGLALCKYIDEAHRPVVVGHH